MIMAIVAEEKTTMTIANSARMATLRDCRVPWARFTIKDKTAAMGFFIFI